MRKITDLPNRDWESGDGYSTQDKVFIPSVTELGGAEDDHYLEVGRAYAYYVDKDDSERIAYEVIIMDFSMSIRIAVLRGGTLLRPGNLFSLACSMLLATSCISFMSPEGRLPLLM